MHLPQGWLLGHEDAELGGPGLRTSIKGVDVSLIDDRVGECRTRMPQVRCFKNVQNVSGLKGSGGLPGKSCLGYQGCNDRGMAQQLHRPHK